CRFERADAGASQHAWQQLDTRPGRAVFAERPFVTGAAGDVVEQHGVEPLPGAVFQAVEVENVEHHTVGVKEDIRFVHAGSRGKSRVGSLWRALRPSSL